MRSLPQKEEKTGLAGKAEFFERVHEVMQENGRADDTEDVEMPYGDKMLVVRIGVDYPQTPLDHTEIAAKEKFMPEPSLIRRGTGRCFNKAHFGIGPKRMRALHTFLPICP